MMRYWEEGRKSEARIEIIPMIDVMMFLLVFFVLLSLNVIPAMGLKTNLPTSSAAKDLKAQEIARITLALSGELQLEGKLIASADLVPALQVIQTKSQEKKINIIVIADEKVEFQRVIDILDVLKGNGFEAVSFATKKK